MGALPVYRDRLSMTTPNNIKLAILRPCLVGATLLLARLLLPVTVEPAQSALITVSYACVALIALLIFRSSLRTSSIDLLRWCLIVTILFAVILIADPATRPLLVFMPRAAITFLLLAATIAIATRRMPMPIAITLVALFVFIPIWAAPAVELARNPIGLTNAVVAASPLTAFAVALDLDYLRTSWFYANSALGSMRYSYPAWPTVCLWLSVLPVAACLATFMRPLADSLNRIAKEAHQ